MHALDELKVEATAAIEAAADAASLEKLRVEWLGKKGRVTDLLKGLGQLSAEERPKAGAEINEVKQLLSALISERKDTLQQAAIAEQLASESLDVTLPGRSEDLGALHPITRTIDRMSEFFVALGFEVVKGLRSRMTTITSKPSISPRITRRARCTTLSISTRRMSCGRIPRGCRFERWRAARRRSV